jgi:hypothetical protein
MNADAVAVESEEVDRPSAGTWCCVCRTAGHFCQADQFTAGDSGNGICDPCAEGKDCDVLKARSKKPEPFEAEPLDVPIAPVRSIPVENAKPAPLPSYIRGTYKKEETTKATELLKSGVSVRDTAKEVGLAKRTVQKIRQEVGITKPANHGGAENQKTRHAGYIGRLLQIEEGKTLTVNPPEGYSLNKFADELMDCLIEHPAAGEFRWKLNTDHSNGRVICKRLALEIEEPEATSEVAMEPAQPAPIVETSRLPPASSLHGLSMPKAFEMVIAEIEQQIDFCRSTSEYEDDSDGMREAVDSDQKIVDAIRGWHPASVGYSSHAERESIYDLALERGKRELHIILCELTRLTKRRDALQQIIKGLEAGSEGERDSRL